MTLGNYKYQIKWEWVSGVVVHCLNNWMKSSNKQWQSRPRRMWITLHLNKELNDEGFLQLLNWLYADIVVFIVVFVVIVHLPNHHCRIISRFISAFAVQLTCLGEREITSFANIVHFGVAWVFVCVNVWARALHKCGQQIWRRRCGQSQYQNDFIRIKWDNIQMFFYGSKLNLSSAKEARKCACERSLHSYYRCYYDESAWIYHSKCLHLIENATLLKPHCSN